MGKAVLKPRDIPVNFDGESFVSKPVDVNGMEYKLTCVSMGNPHAVLFTENIDSLDLEKIGPFFENHNLFPERINTEFVEVIDDKTLKMHHYFHSSHCSPMVLI